MTSFDSLLGVVIDEGARLIGAEDFVEAIARAGAARTRDRFLKRGEGAEWEDAIGPGCGYA